MGRRVCIGAGRVRVRGLRGLHAGLPPGAAGQTREPFRPTPETELERPGGGAGAEKGAPTGLPQGQGGPGARGRVLGLPLLRAQLPAVRVPGLHKPPHLRDDSDRHRGAGLRVRAGRVGAGDPGVALLGAGAQVAGETQPPELRPYPQLRRGANSSRDSQPDDPHLPGRGLLQRHGQPGSGVRGQPPCGVAGRDPAGQMVRRRQLQRAEHAPRHLLVAAPGAHPRVQHVHPILQAHAHAGRAAKRLPPRREPQGHPPPDKGHRDRRELRGQPGQRVHVEGAAGRLRLRRLRPLLRRVPGEPHRQGAFPHARGGRHKGPPAGGRARGPEGQGRERKRRFYPGHRPRRFGGGDLGLRDLRRMRAGVPRRHRAHRQHSGHASAPGPGTGQDARHGSGGPPQHGDPRPSLVGHQVHPHRLDRGRRREADRGQPAPRRPVLGRLHPGAGGDGARG